MIQLPLTIKFIISSIFFINISSSLAQETTSSSSSSTSFIVLGDWGYLPKPDAFKNVMSAVSKYSQDHPFDYFITVGDNIYNHGILNTEDKNFDKAMAIVRDHSNLQKQPMYSVLGNHDCKGDPMAQVKKSGSYGYMMPSDYYTKTWDVDGDGQADFVILFLNACLLVCKNNMQSHFPSMPIAKDKNAIEKHYQWIQAELKKIQNIKWKAVSIHWPAVAFSNGGDSTVVKKYLLPMLQKYKIDVYFSGHTHSLQYLTLDYDKEENFAFCKRESIFDLLREEYFGLQEVECPQQTKGLQKQSCKRKIQILNGDREMQWKKGQKMHFVIEGASGANLGHLCHDSTTIGEIHYGNVKDYSFVYVTVQEKEFKIKYISDKGKKLYEIKIND